MRPFPGRGQPPATPLPVLVPSGRPCRRSRPRGGAGTSQTRAGAAPPPVHSRARLPWRRRGQAVRPDWLVAADAGPYRSGMVPFSILDLAPIVRGGDAAQALRNSLDLARHAERWGYRRFWLAERHNIPGIASSATAVVIGYVAGGTRTIRVGAGGVMLPNHAPLPVAEQFGTLAALYPGRIDLGLGRAPGTDPVTTHALRRGPASADTFPDDVLELQGYFKPAAPGQASGRRPRRLRVARRAGRALAHAGLLRGGRDRRGAARSGSSSSAPGSTSRSFRPTCTTTPPGCARSSWRRRCATSSRPADPRSRPR